ncbi:transmembrane protein [Populus alba x Populus x berolinensis]|nr:transmembrane protein [Populus alba x Populus x berolinensis]
MANHQAEVKAFTSQKQEKRKETNKDFQEKHGRVRSISTAFHRGVLHQRRKLSLCPMKMAISGVALVATLGYFVLNSKKQPEASALAVAKVTAGVADPANTRPHN